MKLVTKKKVFLFIVLTGLFIIPVFGQKVYKSDEHMQEHHNYHVGIGFAATHITNEQGIAPGFHLHFLRQLGEHKNWGVGVGYETFIQDNLHNSFTFLANYHPVHFVSLNAGPGIVLEKTDNKTDLTPAFHIEVVFEFELNKFHIGPMAGFGFDKEDTHFSLGVHVGLGF